ncbi:hypothetical protein SAMN05216319_4036 [Duganella sp. CF402]|nr:hypothetical protein EV582_5069 [Duganella sp. BK701]SEM44917.1 hypothetical protein SAMN05216319_4036 [Duganella sp. CF402]
MKHFHCSCRRHWLGLITAMLVIVGHPQVAAASFHCGRAVTEVEQQVCTNAELSRLDEDVAWLYARTAPAAKSSAKLAQLKWLRERNLCADEACLRNVYVGRIRSLLMSKDLLIPPSPGDEPGETRLTLKNGWVPTNSPWSEVSGQPEDQLCRAAESHMNHYAADWRRHNVVLLDNPCVTASLTIPGMEPPPWRHLVAADHLALIAKLLRLSSEGAQAYFAPNPPAGSRSDAFYRDAAAKFVTDGGQLLAWTTPLFTAVTDARTNETINTAQQQQTVVQMRKSTRTWRDSVATETCRPADWTDSAFMVENDLSGPAPVYVQSLAEATVMRYQGAPVFLRHYSSQFLIDDTESAFGGTRCNLSAITQ